MEKRKEVEESLWATPEKITTSGDSVTSAHGSLMETFRVAQCNQFNRNILNDTVFVTDVRIQFWNDGDLKWPPDTYCCC